jgi:(2R)-3-sulfolactate dehydrogenase (NADP+)
MTQTRRFTVLEATDLAVTAIRAAGASEAVARSLAEATVSAEMAGLPTVGFLHLPDYLASFVEGRINGKAEPVITFPASAMVQIDASGGIAQLGFDRAFDVFRQRVVEHGVAVLAQRNSYTTGEVGYYVRRLADAGLVAMAMSNGSPLLATPEARSAVFSTNPMAFAAPGEAGPAILLDQASSAAAFVNVRAAAERGDTLPPGWALDAEGEPTQDPARALGGALLTFGGAKGANIALLVEIMAAGLTGANWSLDSPSFLTGDRSPGAGLLVIAMGPTMFDASFRTRLDAHMARLSDAGVHIPGRAKAANLARASQDGIVLPLDLVRRIEAFNA